ncbi:universal stress protein [Acuticoccus sediminis]|uniref:universal stress protein n=1 Tax=Acuticoccus sediminis TaxID=2184697 RepID=UPI001CFD6CA3|nr:universal stress protein [Acuticoccus sediminis]
MALKSIICLFDGTDPDVAALETAIAIAKARSAHLRVVHAHFPFLVYGGGRGGYLLSDDTWIEAINRQQFQQEANAHSRAKEVCQRLDLPLDGEGKTLPHASFVPVHSTIAADLLRELSLCDLLVLGGKAQGDGLESSVAEMALFSSGRPALIVRPRDDGATPQFDGERLAVAWNGGPQVVRALVGAIPVMRHARDVVLLKAEGHRHTGATSGDTTALVYLEAHGVNASLEVVEMEHRSAAEAVLDRARELKCAGLVMGAYGHSVFREMVIGGFSQHMLRNCELPLLMSH